MEHFSLEMVKVRDAKLEDVDMLLSTRWPGIDASELRKYKDSHFDETGIRKGPFGGYPEQVWVAVSEDETILGCLHFFTDCWDGYEDTVISLAADPRIPQAQSAFVRGTLETTLREREP